MGRCLPNCSNRCAIPSRPWCAIPVRLVGGWLSWQLCPRSGCFGWLVADELAAGAMGSRREYLRALAKMALRQDSRPTVTPRATLVPVFSGFLLRRILLLRAKDGSSRRDWRRLAQGSAVSLVVAVALMAAAVRGLAQPPGTGSDGSSRRGKRADG